MCSVVLRNVYFTYMNHNKPAIHNVSLTINENEFVLVLGKSGSGKSTLGYIICGLIPRLIPGHLKGEVLIDGRSINSYSKEELIMKVNMLLQDPDAQLTYLTVEDEIKFPMENIGLSKEVIKSRLNSILNLFDLTNVREKYVFNLSYGQKQRVSLASILALDPKVIILDEPLSHQDLPSRKRIVEFLKEIKGNRTIIVMEHRPHELLKLCDKLMILEDGKLIFDGKPNTIKDAQLRDFLFSDLRSLKLRDSKKAQRPVLMVRDLAFTYNGKNYVFSNVNFSLNEGEMSFITGPNGAGKSTLAMVISGLLSPSKGDVVVVGGNKRICYVPQNPDLVFLHDTLYQEVLASATKAHPSKANSLAREILKAFNLWDLRGRDPHLLSRGERVRAAIATMAALKPRVLIIDEPFSGQDKLNMKAILNCLSYLRTRHNVTLLIITHEIGIAKLLGDRLYELSNGRLKVVA